VFVTLNWALSYNNGLKSIFFFSLLQYEVRLKTIAQVLVGGKKRNWHHADRWIGDELGSSAHNPKAAQFNKVVSLIHIFIHYYWLGTISHTYFVPFCISYMQALIVQLITAGTVYQSAYSIQLSF